MTTRLLPHPLLSLLLWVVWLMLEGTFAPGQALLGAAVAVAIPLVLRGWLGATPARPRRPIAIARLAVVVVYDIVRSNIDVMRRVLGPESEIRPGFVQVPLQLTDPQAIAVLSAIITMTPGTLTAEIAPDRSSLTVHALHVDDRAAIAASIRERYERPLLEIFG